MKNLILILVLFIIAVVFTFQAEAQENVVVPNALTDQEGNLSNAFPINCGNSFATQRYQQIYSASQFNLIGTITAIKFRLWNQRDVTIGPAVQPNVQIDMSVTNINPPNASPVFSENLGPDVQTVFNGDIAVFAPPCTTTPCPFDIMVPLDTPFEYNPSQGNLIVDWRLNNCATIKGIGLDGTTNFDNTIQRIFSDDVNSPTGNIDNFYDGVTTQFVIDRIETRPIPALSTWAVGIAVIGFMAGGVIVLRKRAKSKVTNS